MDVIRQTLEFFGDDIVRALIEVTTNHGGRVGFDVVAAELKKAAHCPEFDGDGLPALKMLIKEYRGLMDGMMVDFDDDNQEFFGGLKG